MNYTAPKKIRRGSKVAIVAPASAVDTDSLLEGITLIKELGLVPVLGPCVKNLKSDGMHSAPVMDRVAELNWAFSHPEISAIICAKGGMGSAGVLPYLDYGTIRRSRKPLLGRSDITSLNCGILKHAGLISVCGQTPSIKLDEGMYFQEMQSESFIRTLELMMSNEIWGGKPFDQNPHIPQTVHSGVATGHVIGCNSDTFTRLLGTPYMPDCNGAILFIEDIHQSAEDLAREFLHLKLAGILQQAAGIVIGEFLDSADKKKKKSHSGVNVEDVIQEYFADCGVPCIYGYPFSHGPIVAPVPVGAQCTIDGDSGLISFDFAMC